MAVLDDVRGEDVEVRAGEGAVRAGVLVVRAGAVVDAAAVGEALELLVALVELVVAHGRDVEAERVHRLDRRLVVERGGQQRRRADEVAGRDGERVRVALAGLGEMRGEVLHTAGVDRKLICSVVLPSPSMSSTSV